MTIDDVRDRVAEIREWAEKDNEEAHIREDRLYQDVLRAIADGGPQAPELAREALETNGVRFERWYA